MASMLKVDELRSQLRLRGLDETGTKPILVKRLESAIRREENGAKKRSRESNETLKVEEDASNGSSKRPRDSVDEKGQKAEDEMAEDEKAEERVSIEELKKMTVRQLRELASRCGLPENGTKKELVERLSVDVEKDPEENIEGDGSAALNGSSKRPKESVDDKAEERVSIEELKKMTLRQLCELATHRGLPEHGTKNELVERLSVDAEKDSEDNIEGDGNADLNGSSKRPKESVDEKAEERVSAEEPKKMTLRQLRELAAHRGLPENGTKKELVERLSVDVEKDSEEHIEAKVIEGLKEDKIITATKKGEAVLDQWLPDDVKSSFHVLQWGQEIYDATLNQTNVGENNNKFYVIQALESDDGGKFFVYNRWGRVGVRGQDKLHGPFISREKVIAEFEMKFSSKTGNQWCNRKNFTCYPKCYTWLEMDYDEAEKETAQKKTDVSIGSQLRETRLEPRIAKFISLICNISMMKQQMLEIGYNAEKLPLGKLSKSTILKGYDVLRRISDVISKPDRKALEQLSGEFYTVIPHDFGFKKMHQFIIDTPYKLKSKLDMVAALGEIEIATKILKDDAESGDDPLYSHYRHLHCELTPVEVDSEEFSMIAKYMRNTHAKTHSSYSVDIEQIFKVTREGEIELVGKFSSVKNRMLLWHGSRLTNWTGILSQGLRIAPPEAPSTGYMFGKGVYFADMFSKSANYCFATKESATGVLLLCEVVLGGMAELLAANYNADCLPEGKLSTKGVGSTAPDMSEAQYLKDDVVVPLGKPKEQTGQKGSLQYNEYIVYNVEQIRMRYLLQVKFNWNRSYSP